MSNQLTQIENKIRIKLIKKYNLPSNLTTAELITLSIKENSNLKSILLEVNYLLNQTNCDEDDIEFLEDLYSHI